MKSHNGEKVFLRTLVLERISDPEEVIEGFILYREDNDECIAHFLARRVSDRYILSVNLSPSKSFGMDFDEITFEQEKRCPNTIDRTLYLKARELSDEMVMQINRSERYIFTIWDDRTGYTSEKE